MTKTEKYFEYQAKYWDLINAISAKEDAYNIIDTSIEECSELIQALSKMKRASGRGSKTPVTQEEAFEMVKEELSDVLMCADLLIKILNDGIENECKFEDEMQKIQMKKGNRWLQRLGVEET